LEKTVQSSLIIWRDEEDPMKHRPRKGTKKMKTSGGKNWGGARTMEICPMRNQNLIFWPLANVL